MSKKSKSDLSAQEIALDMLRGKPPTSAESVRMAVAYYLREPLSARMSMLARLRAKASEFHQRCRLVRLSAAASPDVIDQHRYKAAANVWENAAHLLNAEINHLEASCR
jgi:hypothetical protein